MEAKNRHKSSSLKDYLFSAPYEFEFCQAIKILEVMHPDALDLGKFSNPSAEVVCLSSRVAYSYPPSDLYKFNMENMKTPYKLEVNFLGIGGPHGPLPMAYSETLIERTRKNDFAFQEFLNIFNHRILSLLYRGRKKMWPHLETMDETRTSTASILFAFLGLGSPSYRSRMVVEDRSMLAYSGLTWRAAKSEGAYKAIISDYFSLPCMVESLQGEWIYLPNDQKTVLKKNNPWRILGNGASLGEKAWSRTSSICVDLGPMSFAKFKKFLPNNHCYIRFKELSKFYIGINTRVRLRLILKGKEIPHLCLGNGGFLGWTTWLHSKDIADDDGQVVLR
jgi:type VI secretion system protein ImpH